MQPPATDAAIVDAARRLLLDRGWDVAVCLTDLPLHIHRRPVVAHANPVHNVAIVSVPALGAMGARHRIREGIVRLVERLIGSDREREPKLTAGLGGRGGYRCSGCGNWAPTPPTELSHSPPAC